MRFSSGCRNLLSDFLRGGALLLVFGLLLAAAPLRAASVDEAITLLFATLKPVEDSWKVDAAFDLKLNRSQEDALKKGIPLQFVTEFELQRVRAWWLNEDLSATTRTGRLNYSPLTRRYQIETPEGYKAYDTLREALVEIGRIEKWAVVPAKVLKPGNSYMASIRMRLDTGHLPKPLSISVFSGGKWEVEGEWHRWEVTP